MQIYVATNGNDQFVGDIAHPLATVAQAKIRIQQLKAGHPGQALNLSVTIRGGTYYLSQPLTFSEQDSGWSNAPIVYRAYPGERVVFSGGQRLLNWTPVGSGPTYSAPAPSAPSRQLYVGDNPGTHPTRARYPKTYYLTEMKYHFVNDASSVPTPVIQIDLAPDGGIDSGSVPITNQTELVILKTWTQSRLGIAVVSGPNAYGGISIQPTTASGTQEGNFSVPGSFLTEGGFRAYLEGSIGLLTQPGEWALNGGTIVYYPRPGEQLNSAISPALEQLLIIGAAGNPSVHDLTFNELEFHHTTWNLPSVSGYSGEQAGTFSIAPTYIPSAVVINNAQNITVSNCRLSQLGGGAIDIENGVTNTVITGNLIDDVAGNGITIANAELINASASSGITIANNVIEWIGQDYDGVGIAAFLISNTNISHNLIQHVAYSGISLGWFTVPTGTGNNIIASNEITDVMQLYDDGGGIYTPGPNLGTHISENYIHDFLMLQVPNGPGLQAGLYFDGESQGVTSQNNFLYNLTQGIFMQNCGANCSAVNDSSTNEHLVNVTTLLALQPNYNTPAILAANNDVVTYDQVSVPSVVANAGPDASTRAHWLSLSNNVPLGLFQIFPGGVYYNYGTTYCGYATWDAFTHATGLSSVKNIPMFASLPAAETMTGACP
jgi:hypothetical protein